MKKVFALLLATVMVLSLAACGAKTEGPATDTPIAETPAADDTVYTLLMGSTLADDSPVGKAVLEYFKPYVEEHSNGRIVVDYQGNSVLGSDRELYEGLQLNTIQASYGPMSTLANFCPDFAICDFPFLFESEEEAFEALDGDLGQALAAQLPAVGMRCLYYGINAFRNFSNSKHPITSVADMAGLKIRVMEAPVYISTLTALGASPTPMAFSELYTALQQGTVDGQDNGLSITYSNKLYEVQEYYTTIGYVFAANGIIVSESFYQSLPDDLKQVLDEGSKYALTAERKLNADEEARVIGLMEEAGTKFNDIDAAAKAEFRDACMPVWDELKGTISADIYNLALTYRDN